MKKYKLDPEEQEILDAYESGKLQPLPNSKELIQEAQEIARDTLKNQRIHLRLYQQQHKL